LHVNAGSIIFILCNKATTDIYALSLHDALPIWLGALVHGLLPRGLARQDEVVPRGIPQVNARRQRLAGLIDNFDLQRPCGWRFEIGRHTSELQSLAYFVCRLLLEKIKIFLLLVC